MNGTTLDMSDVRMEDTERHCGLHPAQQVADSTMMNAAAMQRMTITGDQKSSYSPDSVLLECRNGGSALLGELSTGRD